MIKELSTAYDPKATEDRIYKKWEESGCFQPRGNGKSYAVHLPPPNITGSLHMGHALNATITDILIRYHRMKGERVVWFPGIDHAGIATQNVVEKQLRKEDVSRWDLGREKFIEKVWEWKEKYGNIILDQLKKIGASCDWSRTRFTMDAEYAKWVQKAFIHYYEKGLIYRGKRVVSWCPRCQTSLSDLEIEYKEEKTKLWYIKYSIVTSTGNQSGDYIIVATTRPETMLGDAAIAVNPKDERYKNLIGKKVMLPIQEREIPIISDEKIEMDFGTGAVKVTPAHDLLDAELGERHKLPFHQVIDERGKMTAEAGKDFEGLKVAEAREKVVAELEKLGLIVKTEDYTHNLAICYRSATPIEPLLSDQWFLKMEKLGKEALKAVQSQKTRILPENFEKSYIAWLENVHDWCISRQIWWGHQLPVWYETKIGTEKEATHFKKGVLFEKLNLKSETDFDRFSDDLLEKEGKSIQWATFDEDTMQLYDGYINVLKERGFIDENWIEKNKISRITRKSKPFVGINPPASIGWMQETDVLDTWFSSALWPFAGLSEADLKDFYPSNILITARDIINLWVGRMIFSGLEFMDKEPFPEALIHGTILTKEGKRMSKSLGTGIDPLVLIEKYGADATRFGIIWQAMGNQDVHWDETAVMAGKKFANKIWNISRFVLQKNNTNMQISANDTNNTNLELQMEDKDILEKLEKIKKEVEDGINQYQFGHALHALYDFIWHDFADKYIEASKLREDEAVKNVLARLLADSLKLLHPFMPFITEEIYSQIDKEELLIISQW